MTPGDTIDRRISGQPEEPYLLNERQATVFLISRLMKQVLKSLDTSTMINDLINNYSQQNAEQVDYYPVPHRDSEIMLYRTVTWNDMKLLKIEDRVQCLTCFKCQRPGETFCICGCSLQGITAEVKKQTKEQLNSRFIMYVPGVHKSPSRSIQRGRRSVKLCRITKTQESKR